MSKEHTLLPWEVRGQEIYGNELNGYICKWSGRTANADFIVKAVNCHADIVKALEVVAKYQHLFDEYKGTRFEDEDCKIIEAAIAKTTGEEA